MDRGGGQGEEKHLIFIIDTLLSSYIEDDQADLAVRGFACTYARTKVALCLPGVQYTPYHWFTRCSSTPDT